MLSSGGSGYWVLNRRKAGACQYVVCARNAKTPDRGATEPHRAAFLVGEISEIVETDMDVRGNRRSLIAFEKYAQVDIPEIWQHWRNPVRYTTMEKLGIDPAGLDFRSRIEGAGQPAAKGAPLTIAEAKRGLAAAFGVNTDAIEIVIRG